MQGQYSSKHTADNILSKYDQQQHLKHLRNYRYQELSESLCNERMHARHEDVFDYGSKTLQHSKDSVTDLIDSESVNWIWAIYANLRSRASESSMTFAFKEMIDCRIVMLFRPLDTYCVDNKGLVS